MNRAKKKDLLAVAAQQYCPNGIVIKNPGRECSDLGATQWEEEKGMEKRDKARGNTQHIHNIQSDEKGSGKRRWATPTAPC